GPGPRSRRKPRPAAVAARRAGDLCGEPPARLLRAAAESPPARRCPGGRGRPGLARAGEAPALRQLRDGGPRRDDRLPDEHEAPAVVTEASAPASTPAARPIRTAAIANLGCKVN